MSTSSGASDRDDIGREQEYVSMLYGRLDVLRAHAQGRLTGSMREAGGTPQARSQRDSVIAMYGERVALFDAVEQSLCFGRLDYLDATRQYIGRIGMFDEAGDYEPLLLDWRAPAARPFYLATAASPDGVLRRRHIRGTGRTVTGLDDEVLDLSAARAVAREEVTGEAALLAALGATRTGRMRDIVETIQAEQDRVIRAELPGVLVVQGGPGTGKTAVALHRAAYLLYTYRDQLAQRAVLVVGPNPTFLSYISQVLPALAETGVLLCTPDQLFPGVRADRVEPPAAAELKGRLVMAEVIAAAIADRQRLPDQPIPITIEQETLWLDRRTCADARARARRSGKLHNLARRVFDEEIVAALARQLADRIGVDPFAFDPLGGDDAPGQENLLAPADLAEIRDDLAVNPGVRAALDELWPILTPRRLLADLFASADRIAAAASMLTETQRHLLVCQAPDGWTPADVPLLDEAAELLGQDDRAARQLAELRQRERVAYAQGALDIAAGSRSIDVEDEIDPELLLATDLIDAERLAERHDRDGHRTAAQRAAADRTWAFGHIIVDEAQELSAMTWRLLMRRSPSRSMTVVGDVAQTGDAAGAASWQDVLEPYVGDRWRLAELSVNYRTPAEVMTVAGRVLVGIDPTRTPPRSVRRTGTQPWGLAVDPAQLAKRLVGIVLDEVAGLAAGRLGVIVPAGRLGDLGAAVLAAVPEAAVGERAELTSRVVVLTVRQAKGLEFDSVLVVDPQGVLDASERGHSDLYVALTRATQRLGVLCAGAVPELLMPLAPP